MGAFCYHYIWKTSNNRVLIFLGYYFVQEQSFWSLASFCLREVVVCIIELSGLSLKSLANGMSLLPFHGFAFFSGSLSHHGLSQFLVAHYYINRGCSWFIGKNALLSLCIYFPYLKSRAEVLCIFVVGLWWL